MPVESASTIADLNALWPLGSDPVKEGDDHLRLIKEVLQADAVDQAQLEDYAQLGGATFTGTVTFDAVATFSAGLAIGGAEQIAFFDAQTPGNEAMRISVSADIGAANPDANWNMVPRQRDGSADSGRGLRWSYEARAWFIGSNTQGAEAQRRLHTDKIKQDRAAWQVLTTNGVGTREKDTTYTNDTGQAIEVMICTTGKEDGGAEFRVNGVAIAARTASSDVTDMTFAATIYPNETYGVFGGQANTINRWSERRP